jgi:hypothetical protein
MSRTLTAVATALWVAPIAGLAVGYFISTDPFPSSTGLTGGERGLGVAIATYLGGFTAGALAFAATYLWSRAYLPAGYLKHVQALDAAGIAALLIWAFVVWQGTLRHAPPEYPGRRATLDVEIRAPKSLLAGGPVTALNAFLENGSVRDTRHLESVREESDSIILPYELEVIDLHDWTVKVYRTAYPKNYELSYYFKLALPRSPKGGVPWSGWIAPQPRNEWSGDGVQIRYRWNVVPQDVARVYRP